MNTKFFGTDHQFEVDQQVHKDILSFIPAVTVAAYHEVWNQRCFSICCLSPSLQPERFTVQGGEVWLFAWSYTTQRFPWCLNLPVCLTQCLCYYVSCKEAQLQIKTMSSQILPWISAAREVKLQILKLFFFNKYNNDMYPFIVKHYV